MNQLGPLDRRTVRKRCAACSRRKIKCEGGLPCLYCTKKKQKCIPPPDTAKTDAVFVNFSPFSAKGCDALAVNNQTPVTGLCLSVPADDATQFLKHFFSEFLVRNNFGLPLDLDTLTREFQSSSTLYHAFIALGALDLSRKRLVAVAANKKTITVGALTAYRTSISNFQAEIRNTTTQQNDAILWTTLFLGLFELMYDVTGEGWVKHILYGTTSILQLRGPEAHLTGPGRSFFITVRVFEICRALIYSEPTFLGEQRWMSLTRRIWDEDITNSWHPKEALFDLMITCSSLSDRVWSVLDLGSNNPARILNKALVECAVEGIIVRTALNSWFCDFQLWSEDFGTPGENPQSILAIIYFHAISIYLSGIFDYRSQFDEINTPTLSQSMIQGHLNAILSITDKALETTNLGGVLFFFPLRVAGARATSLQQRGAILTMLREISGRSFVVADAFTADLKALWHSFSPPLLN